MLTVLSRLFPRILRFWLLHLFMGLIGVVVLYLGSYVQSSGANILAPVLVFILSILFSILYFLLIKGLSRHYLQDRKEGTVFAVVGALPMFLLILAALYARSLTPYNTIPYGYLLLPVTMPFQGWIETVFPLLPMHILALTVPLVFMYGVVSGTAMKNR